MRWYYVFAILATLAVLADARSRRETVEDTVEDAVEDV